MDVRSAGRGVSRLTVGESNSTTSPLAIRRIVDLNNVNFTIARDDAALSVRPAQQTTIMLLFPFEATSGAIQSMANVRSFKLAVRTNWICPENAAVSSPIRPSLIPAMAIEKRLSSAVANAHDFIEQCPMDTTR
jgi:hypothetical protein